MKDFILKKLYFICCNIQKYKLLKNDLQYILKYGGQNINKLRLKLINILIRTLSFDLILHDGTFRKKTIRMKLHCFVVYSGCASYF